jgi:SET domain
MLSHGLGLLAATLQVAGYLFYIKNFLKNTIRPNAASFFMFAYGTLFIFALEWQSGASWPMLALPGACAMMGVIVALMCMRRGATEPVDQLEWTTFGIDVALTAGYAAALWAYGHNPAFALFFLLGGNATTLTAFFPLVRSTWRFPERETSGPWLVWTAAYAALLAATFADGGAQNPALLVYPLINLILHAALALLSLRTSGPGVSFRDGAMHVVNRNSAIHGLGMFAGRPYGQNEELWVLRGRPVTSSASTANPNAVGFAPNVWIDPEPPFEFVNHSCAPNAAFGRSGEFYALRPIAEGEEITMDYSTTEVDPDWVMTCGCGAPSCRKELRAIQIAFADSLFPPPAAPAMQEIWRMQRSAAAGRPAFPQLFPGESAVPAEAAAMLRESSDG